MNSFAYRNGALCAEGVALAAIARQVGTPFYCYSTAALERNYRAFADGLAGLDAAICFAVKANGNLAVIRTLAAAGAGADVVSEGELRRALAAGVAPNRIVFSGVGKTAEELAFACATGIMQINVESEAELDMVSAAAQAAGKRAVISLRLNPDVDANTHHKITTGKAENKFGLEWGRAAEVLTRARSLPGIEIAGLAVHIGSQLVELEPFRTAFGRLRDLVQSLRAKGIAIRRLDLGGGLGVVYGNEGNRIPPSPAAYGTMVREVLGDLGCALVFEPGRAVVADAGVLVARVILVKEGEARRFVVCDAAMNDLIRPALYDSYHAILPLEEPAADAVTAPVDVVGPVCETTDTFARERAMPPLAAGDLIAFASAGAYGAVMASMYNARPLVPEVLVKGDRFALVRARPTYDEMLALERLPEWMETARAGVG
jgi:diaminopimelate decarboxylase